MPPCPGTISTGILYAEAPFEQRLEQVAELPTNAQEKRRNNSIEYTEFREKGIFEENCPGEASGKPPSEPSTLLLGLTDCVQLCLLPKVDPV